MAKCCQGTSLHLEECGGENLLPWGREGGGFSTTLRSQNPREYQAIAAFLSYTGPLISACHRLITYPYISYEFPVSHLSHYIISHPVICPPSWLPACPLACSSSALTVSSTTCSPPCRSCSPSPWTIGWWLENPSTPTCWRTSCPTISPV